MSPARRLADAIIYLAGAGFVLLGLIQLILLPVTGTELSKYIKAGEAKSCPLPQAMATDSCVAYLDATFVRQEPGGEGLYAPRMTVVSPWFSPPTETFLVNRPSPTFYNLRRGDRVQLKVWNGRPTAIQAKASSRLLDNPYDNDDLRTVGGISVLAMGLVLFLVHPPGAIRRKLSAIAARQESEAKSWSFQGGLVAAVTNDLQMRIAVVAFVIAQALDVITSLRGGQVELFEGNPVVAALIKGMGPVLAFFLVKVIAVIVLLLVMARLPRRAALFVVWATSIVFMFVALHNAQLIVSQLG